MADPYRKNNPALKPLAQKLRRNMTKEERHLWYDYLRGYEPRFTRQHPLGPYIADFYCAKAHLVIELDGSQHYEPEHAMRDNIRTARIHEFGITVIRFPNNAVTRNFRGVCEHIDLAVKYLLNGEHPPELEIEAIT